MKFGPPQYQEVMVRADDHVLRIAHELVRQGAKFSVKPERDGWWRVRAWFESPSSITAPLLPLIASETLAVRP